MLPWLIYKSELITCKADEIIEIQLFVRVNLDIENLKVTLFGFCNMQIFNRQHFV